MSDNNPPSEHPEDEVRQDCRVEGAAGNDETTPLQRDTKADGEESLRDVRPRTPLYLKGRTDSKESRASVRTQPTVDTTIATSPPPHGFRRNKGRPQPSTCQKVSFKS